MIDNILQYSDSKKYQETIELAAAEDRNENDLRTKLLKTICYGNKNTSNHK